ncbi:hypothetical protein D9M70_545550 [compost metagenome]
MPVERCSASSQVSPPSRRTFFTGSPYSVNSAPWWRSLPEVVSSLLALYMARGLSVENSARPAPSPSDSYLTPTSFCLETKGGRLWPTLGTGLPPAIAGAVGPATSASM